MTIGTYWYCTTHANCEKQSKANILRPKGRLESWVAPQIGERRSPWLITAHLNLCQLSCGEKKENPGV